MFLLLTAAYTAEDNRLTLYTAQTGYTITVTQFKGTPYVGLADVLDPLGKMELRIDGSKVRLKFAAPDGSTKEAEFQPGKTRYKAGGEKFDLASALVVQNERPYVPLASLTQVLDRLLGQPIQYHEASRRMFLGGTGTRFVTELRKTTPSTLVIRFDKPVNPFIATEPGKLRMVFTRDPVISSGTDHFTFADPLIANATYAEYSGLAEFTVNASAPLIASFSEGGRTITVSAAPGARLPAAAAAPQSVPPVEPAQNASDMPAGHLPLTPRAPRFLVVIDPAHGGDERGAALSDTLQEKDVTLALARRIGTQLEAKNISAILLRSADVTNSLDQRATAANAMQPSLYVTVHAATLGRGSSLFTAQLPPSTTDGRRFLPWETAQAAYLDLSAAVAGSIAAELTARQVPVRALPASVRPLNNIAAPAIAIEVSPASNNVLSVTDSDYQQRIAGAVAAGVAAVRSKLEAAR